VSRCPTACRCRRGCRELEQARKRVDHSRDNLYSVAQQHAYLLAEVEKLILRTNQDVANEMTNDPEA
jgi:hypothetical protein